jgi:DNA-binding NarL/FixJ family response regulator
MPGRPNESASILIVDPEQSVRALTADVLRSAGYSTLEAESGEQALELAERERPRVVVLEVQLPGICGYEVCRALRETFDEEMSIIFLTGVRKESFDRVAGLLLGADDYLVKPLAPDELLARVRRLIRHSPPPASGIAAKLTQREQDVLQLLAEGLDPKEIASRLSISPKTVGSHTEHIFAKLGVHNRAQVVALAYREDLVDRGPFDSLAVLPLILPGGDLVCEWLTACSAALTG